MSKDEKEIANTKSQLRDFYRKERKARFIADSWLHILSAVEFTDSTSKNFASYLSYDVEPSTIDINKKLIQSGANLFLPRVLKNNDVEWVQWSGDEKQLKKVGKILEPIGAAVEQKLDVIIVPALHIDQDGNRLGQGGGSYDRALARSSAWKVALVHPGEITSEALPTNAYDQKVDAAATPMMLIRF
ncbi:MAG: 5-formyltetrahydrofolate cyclo-ligase [Actinomycetes bacterium]